MHIHATAPASTVPRYETVCKIDEDILESTFRVNYAWGLGAPEQQPEVFTGNRLSWAVQQVRGGSREDRGELRKFEQFLSEEFFSGKPIELVPRAETKDEHQRLAISIGSNADRMIHEVGDGIQAIIIMMYRLFTATPGTWVFIEDPEINLHPGLQRIFLHALAHNEAIAEKNLRVFMTTHSNHLLGTLIPETKDISIFSFQETETPGRFFVRPVFDRDHNPMTLLGVTNSSVYLANCAIWVEGITDRKYLRAYLKAYQESQEFKDSRKRLMREDIHYAFLEYAGSNLAHYLFEPIVDEPILNTPDGTTRDVPTEIHALALCNRIFVLADLDTGKETKHARLSEAMKDTAGNLEYHTTSGIEIENLIPTRVLQLALPRLIQRGDQGSIVAAVVNDTNYRNKRLGAYLRTLLGPACPNKLAAKGGTLAPHYKDKLATIVTDIVPREVQWADLGKPVHELITSLYNFIERHNR